MTGHSKASMDNSDLPSAIRPSVDYMIPEPVANYVGVPDVNSVGVPNVDIFEASKVPTGGFLCHYCSKFTNHKNDMRKHIRTHTGKKLLCPICGRRFSQNDALNLHMFTVHKSYNQ